MGLFVILHGMKCYYERYFRVLLSWAIIKYKWQCYLWFCESKHAGVVRLWEISRFCHSCVEFRFAATFGWNLWESFNLQFVEKLQRRTWKSFEFFWINVENRRYKCGKLKIVFCKKRWNYRDLRSHDFTRSASRHALAAKCIHIFMTSWCIWVQHRPWISPRAARKYFQYITPFS